MNDGHALFDNDSWLLAPSFFLGLTNLPAGSRSVHCRWVCALPLQSSTFETHHHAQQIDDRALEQWNNSQVNKVYIVPIFGLNNKSAAFLPLARKMWGNDLFRDCISCACSWPQQRLISDLDTIIARYRRRQQKQQEQARSWSINSFSNRQLPIWFRFINRIERRARKAPEKTTAKQQHGLLSVESNPQHCRKDGHCGQAEPRIHPSPFINACHRASF